MNQATPPHDDLEQLRRRINELDDRIVALLNERATVVVEIGLHKRDNDVPIYAPDREQCVLDRVRQANAGPLPDRCIEAVWRELMSGSFALERALAIGYLGPAGSFSHLAARRQFGASVDYRAYDSIPAVFHGVETKQIDYALVPIENSIGGGIHESLDCFLQASAKVCAEVLVSIQHHLMSHAVPQQIKRILSRPEIFEQCRRWLSEHLRDAERIMASSSAKAAEVAAVEHETAAIGSQLASEIYRVPIRFADIEDNPNNITRFFVIGRQETQCTGDDKTAVVFTTAHKPGALASVLDEFSSHGVNLTHIDKRPSQRVNWEYYFFVDCEGHQHASHVRDALEAARAHCLQLTVLGSFPRARNVLQ